MRDGGGIIIVRVRAEYESTPDERPDAIIVRDSLAIEPRYPPEADSTTIIRIADVELLTEIIAGDTRAPQTLPTSGVDVTSANPDEIVTTLGLATGDDALAIGTTTGGGV